MTADINKTRSFDLPGDPSNPNRCRDDALIKMVMELSAGLGFLRQQVYQLDQAVNADQMDAGGLSDPPPDLSKMGVQMLDGVGPTMMWPVGVQFNPVYYRHSFGAQQAAEEPERPFCPISRQRWLRQLREIAEQARALPPDDRAELPELFAKWAKSDGEDEQRIRETIAEFLANEPIEVAKLNLETLELGELRSLNEVDRDLAEGFGELKRKLDSGEEIRSSTGKVIIKARQPAQTDLNDFPPGNVPTPSEAWLRKMADAEDAAGSVSVGGLAADTGQPSPEPAPLIERWVVVDKDGVLVSLADSPEEAERSCLYDSDRVVHLREVPSPERVQLALDRWACQIWPDRGRASSVVSLLRALGIEVPNE